MRVGSVMRRRTSRVCHGRTGSRWRGAEAWCALVARHALIAALGTAVAWFGLGVPARAAIPVHLQTVLPSKEFDEVRDVAVSPDGAHVYVASAMVSPLLEPVVIVLETDPGTGEVAIVETVTVPVDDQGLASGIVVSPNGAHVYVSVVPLPPSKAVVAVYSRDGISGALTFVEAEEQGVNGVAGLDFPEAIAMSPDGAHVYAASQGAPGNVVVFSRDAVSGALTFTAVVPNVGSLLTGLVVSPDGGHVYVTTRFESLIVLARDAVTGALTFVESHVDGVGGVSGMSSPVAVAISDDGGHVYVAASTSHDIVAFARDGSTGMLTFVEAEPYGDDIAGQRSVAVSADGASVYVGWNGGVTVFDRDSLGGGLTFREAHASDSIGSLRGADAIAVSSDGLHVYVGAGGPFGGQALNAFDRAPATGSLTFVEAQRGAVRGLDFVTGMAVSPDGAHLYTACAVDQEIGVFSRDSMTGVVAFVDAYSAWENGVGELSVGGVTVSPDGDHVYVAGPTAVTLFERDAATGVLTFVETYVHPVGVCPTSFASCGHQIVVSPDGGHVYARRTVFSRDGVTGALTFVEDTPGAVGIEMGIAVAPDGSQLFIAHSPANNNPDGALNTYDRDAGTGLLTLVGKEDASNINGLKGARDVATSPDGLHVYTTSRASGAVPNEAVSAFRRDPSEGVAFVQRKTPGSPDVDGPFFPRQLAVSPDGGIVYVTTGTLVLFSRDAGTGKLTQRHAFPSDLYFSATSLAVSPDGANAYVANTGGRELYVRGFASSCPATPFEGSCRSAGRSRIVVKDNPKDTGDTVLFSWTRGEETLLVDFGDPVAGSTDYTLCVYQEGPGGQTLVAESNAVAAAQCAAGPCWKQLGDRFAYLNSEKLPDGMVRVALRAGETGKASVSAKANGPHLDLAGSPPFTAPVTAQVLDAHGECWSTTFTSADILKNEAPPGRRALFRARQ